MKNFHVFSSLQILQLSIFSFVISLTPKHADLHSILLELYSLNFKEGRLIHFYT